MVSRAGTLLIPSGPTNNTGLKHLHIVCTDPCVRGYQMLVSVTTWTNHLCDGTCILEADDHDWLTHQSWVMYRKTRLEEATTLDNGVDLGIFIPKQMMQNEVFDRVVAGICLSPQTPRKMKNYFGCPVKEPGDA